MLTIALLLLAIPTQAALELKKKTDQPILPPLHMAAQQNKISNVITLIKKGADINEQNEQDGDTPLHIALKKKHFELAKFLSYNGADPNLPNNAGDTPLHLAIDKEDSDLVAFLLENGGDVTVRDGKGNSALKRALLRLNVNTVAIVNLLIVNGADATEIDSVIQDEKKQKGLKNNIAEWELDRKNKLQAAEQQITLFSQNYSPFSPSESFYRLAQTLRIMGLTPADDIVKLDGTKNEVFDKNIHLAFIADSGPFSPRSAIDCRLGKISTSEDQETSDAEILETLKAYAKLLPYHYKIHLMPRAQDENPDTNSMVKYFVDQAEALSLITQVVRLFLYDKIFRRNVEAFKVMRMPVIARNTKNATIPFIVIYPRMRPGCAQTVARLLDEKLVFTPPDDSFPFIHTPRFNLKFNPKKPDSGIFYAMGDGDYKGIPKTDKLLYDKNVVLFNDTIAKMAGYHASFKLTPKKKRGRKTAFDRKRIKKMKK